MTTKSIKAVAVFTDNVKGNVKFAEIENKIRKKSINQSEAFDIRA